MLTRYKARSPLCDSALHDLARPHKHDITTKDRKSTTTHFFIPDFATDKQSTQSRNHRQDFANETGLRKRE